MAASELLKFQFENAQNFTNIFRLFPVFIYLLEEKEESLYKNFDRKT